MASIALLVGVRDALQLLGGIRGAALLVAALCDDEAPQGSLTAGPNLDDVAARVHSCQTSASRRGEEVNPPYIVCYAHTHDAANYHRSSPRQLPNRLPSRSQYSIVMSVAARRRQVDTNAGARHTRGFASSERGRRVPSTQDTIPAGILT
ncbi:hypothetical protein CONLIGDRAFT_687746 [Coniochaeta ligniaria NRRL 30616]|uniref:Uncharacterized protein n=1 Tax=Coniochaeta ligniaria NRRL 30616 TaxID=1408157 RepID=A0A1J7I3X8_9PEZI|nr:hypothetical protein CONLIGDRAFT_687746 [Coniochaeta ligniaria NRRL 30616]